MDRPAKANGAAAVLDDIRQLRAAGSGAKILDLFKESQNRAEEFSVEAEGLLLDFSKTHIDAQGLALLLGLADKAGLHARREAMFSGGKINETENRAVLHTALRSASPQPILVDGADVAPEIRRTLQRMEEFSDGVRSGRIAPPAGGRFTDVVNIGIGGSDLGPAMATAALAPYHDGPRLRFVSNVDGAHIADTLRELRPETTLFLVASKTFTTIETITNAITARGWIAESLGEDRVGGHFAAVSSAVGKAREFGVQEGWTFGFGDWVGGRYSVWGPVGLPVMIAVGPGRFREFLAGAEGMDRHFRSAEPRESMPLLLALCGIWHTQVCGFPTRAILPYEQRLARLPAYLQQLEMESNGKSVALDGSALPVPSGPVVWGEAGTNGQHAFHQLLHQGTGVAPCEFLVGAECHEEGMERHHDLLVANCLAQSEALMRGRGAGEARQALLEKGLTGEGLERLARHMAFPGDRPSTTLVYKKLTPKTLGRIIALYEHRVFAEGVILGINSFDQWGVELGKEIAADLEPAVSGAPPPEGASPSTRRLIGHVRSLRRGHAV